MPKAIDLFPGTSEIRNAVLDQLAALTPEQLEWTPAGSKNSIAFYLRHLAQSEDWFLTAWIKGEPCQPRRRAELPDYAAMRRYLDEVRTRTEAYLAAVDATELLAPRPGFLEGFRGKPRESTTVGWLINRIFQHEAYHFGQIQLLLRLQGIEPATAF